MKESLHRTFANGTPRRPVNTARDASATAVSVAKASRKPAAKPAKKAKRTPHATPPSAPTVVPGVVEAKPRKVSPVFVANDLATKVLALLRDTAANAAVRVSERVIAETFRASRAGVASTMRLLMDAGQVVAVGSGRAAHYRISGSGSSVEAGDQVSEPTKKPRARRSKGAAM